jgi:hypothetical protein
MNNAEFGNMILADSQRIATAISTGAAWEIWMQVELCLILRGHDVQAWREGNYPYPNQAWLIDVVAKDNFGSYAVELKAESATNAGRAILNGINQDRAKIAHYAPQNPGARWVVGIGYSGDARNAMAQFAGVSGNNTIFAEQNSVGVLIATV